jgi:imidazoleglycerol phosphate dehydratase HisB
MSRTASIDRKTTETEISIKVNLDGTGKYDISTGIGFFNHMLELFSKHSLIDLTIEAKGDLHIDEHHTIEDVGIVLGQAIAKALGEKKGIERYGFLLPMDESLAQVALDLGGRTGFVWDVEFTREMINDMPTELFEHFWQSFADNLKANLHIILRYGKNDHHKAEAIFKCVARALRFAISQDKKNADLMPSTKGSL